MAYIDLIYDSGCPNADMARNNLRRALVEAGMPAKWREWVRSDPRTPTRLRGFGSPTILVGGRDVAGAAPLDGAGACRIYQTEDRRHMGVPPKSVIVTALRSDGERHPAKRARKSWLGSLATVPGAVAAFLPTFSCPACWPAYAAVLSAAGIGFLGNEKYLLPVTVVLLTATVGALAYAARRRRRYGPLLLGAIGSVAILLAKFMFHIPSATYMAAGLILVASVWNAWAGRPKADSCPSCATERP